MRPQSGLVLILLVTCCGCQQSWVRKKTNLMNRTVPELYYEQVLDNVALAIANPASMAYFGQPTQTTTANTRQVQAGYTPTWDFITTGTSIFRKWFLDHQGGSLTGTNIDAQTYQITPLTDPDKIVLLNEVFHLVAGNYAADPTNDPLWTYYCFHQKKQPDCKVICPCSCCPPVPFPRCPPPHTEVEQLANTLLNDAHSLAAANGLTPAQQTDAQELLSKAQWLYDAIVNAHCPQSAVQLAQEMDNNATALHAQLHAGTPAETLAQSVVNDADALLNKVAGIACPQDAVTLAHEALTDAQSYLTHLQNINAPANQVSDAQTLVNNAQAFYNAQKTLAAAQAASANAAASGCHPCDTWTYANYQKLLQQIIARGGWSRHVADRKKDVPKDACYVSHQCGIYVWVDQSNVTDLRDLTLVVLDIASADLNSLNQGDTHSSSQKKQSLQAHAAKLRVDSMRAQLQALRYTAQRAAERDTTQRQVFSNRIDNLNSEAASLDSLAATLDALAAAEPITVSPTPSRAPRLGPGFPFPAPPAPPTVSP